MPPPTPRLAARVKRDFKPDHAIEVLHYLEGLSADEYGRDGLERIQAALVLGARGKYRRFLRMVDLLHTDWRDALVAGGLANEDWPDRLDAELG